METDNTFLAPLSPVQRKTPSDRLVEFNRNSYSIYTKFSPYDQSDYGSTGPRQPFIYTKLTDPESKKNRMRNESQAIPTQSTIVDVDRITQFLRTGTGQVFLGKQYLLQNTNAFNETRFYNPGSILGATAKAGSFGLIDRPNRHLRTNGGIVNFFIDSVLSTIGFETRDFTKEHIEGTAGTADNSALPTYTRNALRTGLSGAEAGLVRLQTAKKAFDRFDTIWAGSISSSGGILQRVADAALNRLNSLLPSTNPLGIFGGSTRYAWQYRPEYLNNRPGIYYKFLNNADLLSYRLIGSAGNWSAAKYKFYNDPDLTTYNAVNVPRRDFHFYYPQEITTVPRTDNGENWYAHPGRNAVKLTNQDSELGMIKKYNQMFVDNDSAGKTSYDDGVIFARKSMERYGNVKYRPLVGPEIEFPGYYDIPSDGKSAKPYSNGLENDSNSITVDKRGFAKVSTFKSDGSLDNSGADKYNLYYPLQDNEKGKLDQSENQSKDLIYFYFYDLINKVFVPFRATLAGINEQNVADWEEIKYMGRADSLFVYKGFTRDMGFNFKVYANSIQELVPMWERVNYLVGLTRPSKYTSNSTPTNRLSLLSGGTANFNLGNLFRINQSNNNGTSRFFQNSSVFGGAATPAQIGGSADGIVPGLGVSISPSSILPQSYTTGEVSPEGAVMMSEYRVTDTRVNQGSTGREKKFIYPPMITFRIGDLYVDQPAILSSVSITIPDDATWESFRGDSYEYLYGVGKTLKIDGAKSRQLPQQVDVSVQLRLLEKKQSLTSNAHYGKSSHNANGITTERWML